MTLLGLGSLLLIIGSLWAPIFPVSKADWSSSFLLVMAGWANLVLALIYYLSDVRKIKFGSIFRAAGFNTTSIFFLAGFIGRLMGSIKVVGELPSMPGCFKIYMYAILYPWNCPRFYIH